MTNVCVTKGTQINSACSGTERCDHVQIFHCDYCRSQLYKKKERFTERLGIANTKFNVVKCKNCGFVNLFPFPTEEELQNIYSGYVNKY